MSGLTRTAAAADFRTCMVAVMTMRAMKDRQREEALAALAMVGSLSLGREILTSQDASDLEDKLDAALEAPVLEQLGALAAQVAPPDVMERELSRDDLLVFMREVGTAEDALGEVVDLFEALLSASAAVVRFVAEHADEGDALEFTAPNLTDLMRDPLMPPEVLEHCMAGIRFQAILFALLHGLFHPPAEWLRDALLTRMSQEMRVMLRFLAAFPGVEVSPVLLPPNERVDLRALAARIQAAQAKIEASLDAAKASGLDEHPPRDWND